MVTGGPLTRLLNAYGLRHGRADAEKRERARPLQGRMGFSGGTGVGDSLPSPRHPWISSFSERSSSCQSRCGVDAVPEQQARRSQAATPLSGRL